MKRTSIAYRHKVIKKIARQTAKQYEKKYNPVFKKFEKLVREHIRLYGYSEDYTQWVKPLLDIAFEAVDEEEIKEYMFRQNKVKYFALGFLRKINRETKKKSGA